jgi:tRNA (cytidine56-2'-O)-methyltransferase
LSKIYVLRIGHRIHRDLRVSTHCALVAHAFGADGIIFSGDRDGDMIDGIRRTIQRWGGAFTVEYDSDWRGRIADFKMARGFVIHLTMYGINLPDAIGRIRSAFREENVLLVAGSQKVPPDVYRMADANVAVTNLPHSEVASISTILDWIFEGKELSRQLPRSMMKIVPQDRGKRVVKDI